MKSTLFPIHFFACLAFFLWFHNQAEARILFVSETAVGTADGSSWTNAFLQPQDAIDVAVEGDTICVAAGVYLPTHQLGIDTLRSVTFYVNKPISLYGGFEGIPGTEGNFSVRNPNLFETILSGDTGIPGDREDNVFHVVYFDHVSDSTRLDGFIVENGGSLNNGGFDGTGTGVFNNADAGRSHPVLANCVIRNNVATESGGGFLNYAANGGDAQPLLINCTFTGNTSSGGGGFSNYTDTEGTASPTFIGCRLMGNTARTADGGAFNTIAHSSTAAPIFINCIITGNHSPNSAAISVFVTGTGTALPHFINSALSGNTGGAIRLSDIGSAQNSSVTIHNSIVFGNAGGTGISTNGEPVNAFFSIIPFGFAGENIIGLDPLWVSQPPLDSANTEGDLHLQEGSPAIDAGRNEDVPPNITTDLDHLPRFINPTTHELGTVDIGPYEVQSITTSVSPFLSDADWQVSPTLTYDHVIVNIVENNAEGSLRILDMKGNVITTQPVQKGQNQYSLDVSPLAPGTYLVHLQVNGMQDVKKIVVQ